ncbi:hypothetical protein [uncultured Proteiniphilum sp.]|uniref:hypothetical protein n=1 Tax=uncultured Proteiniphilum sp. TaxID=497637 RepID=UPI00261ADFF4|nr:hypothetical protein [uncultured Proteiniphilum sp.]
MKCSIILFLLIGFGALTLPAQTRNYDQELADLLYGLRFEEAIDFYGQHKDSIFHPFTTDSYKLLTNIHLNKPDSFFLQLPSFMEKYYGSVFKDEMIPFLRSLYFNKGDNENGLKTVEILDPFLLKQKERKRQRLEEYAGTINEFKGDIYELAELKNITLPSLPWHLMQVKWSYADSIIDFQRIDMDIMINQEVSTDYCLYISPFNGTFNGEQFYAGIQTNIGGSPTKENLTETREEGKGGIFSRWSYDQVTPIGVEYVEMYENGLCASAGNEGEFCSVRRPYEWTKGTYTLSLIKEETIEFKGEPHTWVCMTITDRKDGTITRIGRLLFSGRKLLWRNDNKAFVEIYCFKDNKRYIPEAEITFKRPMIGDIPIPLSGLVAHQPVSATTEPNGNTPNCAYVTSENTDVTVHITSEVRQQSKNEIYHVIMPDGIVAGF